MLSIQRIVNKLAEKSPRLAMTAISGAFGLVIGLFALVTSAVGQILALGLRQAHRLYGAEWLRLFLWGAVAGFALAVLSWFLTTFMTETLPAFQRRVGPKGVAIAQTIFISAIIISFAGTVARSAFQKTRKEHPRASSELPSDAAGLSRAVDGETAALSQLSGQTTLLHKQLGETEASVHQSRIALLSTLQAFERQRALAVRADATLQDLSSRHDQINRQIASLRHALGGQEPLTKADLASSQRSGLWQGFILGVLTSVLGSVLYQFLLRLIARFRARRAV